MAMRKETQGSGMTVTEALFFEGELSPEEELALEEVSKPHTADGRMEAIEEACAPVLAAAGLPAAPGNYECDEHGNWRHFGEPEPQLRGQRFMCGDPWSIAKRRGIEPDSPVGFAARMIDAILWLRKSRAHGDNDRALMLMFYLGVEWAKSGIKEKHQATWDTGHAQREYLSEKREKNNRKRQDERSRVWAKWNEEAAKVSARWPALSKSAVAVAVKRNLGLSDSIRTVRDRLKKVGEAG